jgi:galactonate dehydratase
VLAAGYRALKVDPFGPGAYELSRKEKSLSIGILEALRDAVGPDVEIFVEGHGRFSASTAAELAREMAPFRPGWFEEPVPPDNHDEMANAVRKIGGAVPVAAGERCFTRYEARGLLERGNIDIAQFDVSHCGGILELKKMAAQADARYVPVAPHNSQGPVCTAASVHADFTMTNFKIQEVFEDFVEPHVGAAVIGRPVVKDGFISPPTRPGLGVELDEEVIRAHPPKKVFFNLWSDDWHKRGFSGGGKAPRGRGRRHG